jgi:hypothetical protein
VAIDKIARASSPASASGVPPGEAPASHSPWLWSAWLLLLLLAWPAAAQPVEPAATYSRTYTNYVLNQPQVTANQPQVTVAVAGAVDVYCFTIEETLPAGATALNVSDGGVYLPDLNVIRWGPYFDTVATTVTYQLTGLPANYPVNGGAWMDGQWLFSPGVTVIPVLPPGSSPGIPSPLPQMPKPVFTPPGGSPVPTSGGVTLSVPSMPSAQIYYTVNGTLPVKNGQYSTQYASVPITGLPLNSAGVGVVWAVAYQTGYLPSVAAVAYYGPQAAPADATVNRSVNTTGSPTMPVVSFALTPGANAQCVTVTETLPAGLSAINVSSGGNYSAANNVVEWGPFLGPFSGTTALTLSYQAKGLPGSYPVRAAWSVDGTNGGETSATSLVIASPAVYTIPTPPPQLAEPTFTPPGGSPVPASGGVTIQVPNMPSAQIYYTENGTLPVKNGQYSTLYTGPIVNLPAGGAGVVWAVAYQAGYLPSVAVAHYGPAAAPADAAVARSVNTTGSPTMPMVNFAVTPGANAQCVAITETLPAGLAAINVSSGGHYLAANNVVEWGPFLGPFSGAALPDLSYQAVGLPGTYPVRAAWSVDGTNGGETSAASLVIVSPAFYPIRAPLPQEPKPVLTPALDSSLPVTVFISCSDVTAKIYYTTDGTLPTQGSTPASPNSTLYTVPLHFSTKTSLRAVAFGAALPSVAASGEYVPVVTTETVALQPGISGNGTLSPTFTLTATPQGVSCYAVEESIPYGLTPSALSGNGSWDPAASVIRWGPYLDGQQRVFSFDVAGATGIYALSGQVSFDGYSTTTTRSVQVNQVPDTTPPTVSITSLSDGDTVTSVNLLVSGTATDSGTGNNGIAYVTVNGLPASNGTASGANTANWSAIVPLHSGVNTIIVLASDTLGNLAEKEVTVTYNPPALVNTGVQGGGGGQQNLVTTLTGLSAGETVTVEESTDLKNWTVPQNLGFQNPFTVTGSTATLSIPIYPTMAGQYFQVIVVP